MFLKVYQLRIGHGYATTLEVKNSRSSYILELVLPKYKIYFKYLELLLVVYILQKISDRNKGNRAKNETHTTVGTKSLARVVEEKVIN